MPATLTINLIDIAGNPVIGSIKTTLVNYGSNIPRIIGTGFLVLTQQTFAANNSGVVTATVDLNNAITPSGTYYEVTFYDATGTLLKTVPYAPFNTAGTYDLSTLAPLTSYPVTKPPSLAFGNLTGTISTAQLGTVTGSGAVVLQTSPTLITPVISSIVNTGTLTLPTSTDTLVGRATTDVSCLSTRETPI
jgi:hypothetical protein